MPAKRIHRAKLDERPWRLYLHSGKTEYRMDPTREPLYNTQVAARLIGVPRERLLRWEKVGILTPAKNQAATRYYSDADIAKGRQIQAFMDIGGINIAGVRTIFVIAPDLTCRGDANAPLDA